MGFRATNLRVEVGPVPKKKEKGVIYFPDFNAMSKVLNDRRVKLLNIIKAHKPESIYHLAELAGMDQANVTRDIKVLEEHGFITVHKTTEGRIKSEPVMDSEGIDVLIKIGAGTIGIAQEALESLSAEFKGKQLEENKKYVKQKYASIVKPVTAAVRKLAKIDLE